MAYTWHEYPVHGSQWSDECCPRRTSQPSLPLLGLQEELQRTLAQRRLDAEGSRAELEARLAAFLAAPAQHPQADCSPAGDVRLVGGRLFGGVAPLRRHIQLLFELLQARPGTQPCWERCARKEGVQTRRPGRSQHFRFF